MTKGLFSLALLLIRTFKAYFYSKFELFFQTLISPSRWSESVSNIIGYKSGVSYSLTHWKDRCTFLFSLFSRGPEFL